MKEDEKKSIITGILVITVVAMIIISFFLVPKINHNLEFYKKEKIGYLNNSAINLYIGNVAIPNKIDPRIKKGKYLIPEVQITDIDPSFTYWDVFYITSPVGEKIPTDYGYSFMIPWTYLVRSVSETIRKLDPKTAYQFDRKFAPDPSGEKSFGSFTYFEINKQSDYHNKTKIDFICGINLFDFTDVIDFENYENEIKNAITASVKMAIQDAGKRSIKSVAFPAFAGAKNVLETELVISYKDSFSSILKGIKNAEGPKPVNDYHKLTTCDNKKITILRIK